MSTNKQLTYSQLLTEIRPFIRAIIENEDYTINQYRETVNVYIVL